MKRRGLIFSGTIVGTVLFALLTFGCAIEIPILTTTIELIISAATEQTAVYASIMYVIVPLLIVSLLFYVTSLVLNACSIPVASATAEKFRKRRGVIIATVVFDFVTFFFSFGSTIFQFVAYYNPFAVFSILMEFGILASGILLLVDLCREKSRAQQSQNAPAAAPAPVAKPEPTPEPKPEPKNEIDAMAAELNKLNQLKQSGIISDEEYTQLKHKILMKY